MITEINIQALKGVTGAFAAGKLNIVTGPNSCGKTAITDAIRLCLLGEHPEIGKTAAALFQMASGPAMNVNLQFDDRPGFRRSWSLKGKTVKMTTEGDEPDIASAPLNVREFLGANAKTRLSMVMETGGQDVVRVAAERLMAAGHELDTFEAMEAAAAAYEKEASEHRAVAKRYSGMLEGTAVVDAQTAATTRPDIKGATAALAAAAAAYAAASAKWNQLRQALSAAEDAKEAMPEEARDPDVIMATIADIEEKLVDSTRERSDAQYRIQELSKEESQLAVEEAKLASAPASDPAEIDRIQALATPTNVDVGEAGLAAQRAERDRMRIESDIMSWEKSRNAADSERAGFDTLECCPTCKAAADGWKAEVLKAMDTKVSGFHILITSGQADLVKAKAAEETSKATYTELHYASDQRQRIPMLESGLAAGIQIQHTRRRLTEVRDMIRTLQVGVKDRDTTIEKMTADRKDFQGMQAAAGKAKELQKLIDAEPHEDVLLAAHSERDAAEHAREGAETNVQDAQAAALQLARDDERASNMRAARDAMDKATADAASSAEKAKEIRKIMQEEMSNAFWRISRAAQNLEEIFPLAILEGQIGRWHGATFAPFDALSGTEQLLATIAIQVGLQGGQGALVMLDELSRLTAENKRLLRNQLQWMVAINQIEQVFVIDHDAQVWTEGAADTDGLEGPVWTRIEPTRNA